MPADHRTSRFNRDDRNDFKSNGDKYKRHGGAGGDDYSGDFDEEKYAKKKNTGRCRLFVGNLPLEMKESEVRELFKPFGEVAECFSSGKGFAFVRMDTRAHAEAAKESLDGNTVKNRPMRVRFAVHGAAIKIKELSPFVSNELLYQAFSAFGEVERAVHIVDEKGRPIGEGIVEFERKHGALDAIRKISEGVFLITGNPRPIHVEPLEPRDEDDGLSERMIHRNAQYAREREQPPRFANPGSFQHEFGNRWKELYQLEKTRREQVERELKEARQQLEADMDMAYQDYQAALLREDLRRRQEELERLEAAKRDRMDAMRRRDDARMAAQQDEMFGIGYRGGPPQGHGGGFGGDMGPQGGPPPFGGPGGPEPGRGPGDENLVHGVQKLLQMFKGGPNPGGDGPNGPGGDPMGGPDMGFHGGPPPHQQNDGFGPGPGGPGGPGGPRGFDDGFGGPPGPGGPPGMRGGFGEPPMMRGGFGDSSFGGPGGPPMGRPPMGPPGGFGDVPNKRRRYYPDS